MNYFISLFSKPSGPRTEIIYKKFVKKRCTNMLWLEMDNFSLVGPRSGKILYEKFNYEKKLKIIKYTLIKIIIINVLLFQKPPLKFISFVILLNTCYSSKNI